ncbi:helicase-associated domain-containing protein [Paenibacillus sp.]|uniref:helicase-associated domain-containing protein n=1 Tax=Paenibacillus sp. TaxID=58172 RepID=UPI002D4C9C6A|nr:helicase-associated domain-containing protein [Paenibacillus sp.]HZG84496.1 helicase-associated domain-containing protein [Paenibacillus sp.]
MNELTNAERRTLEWIVLRFAEEPFDAGALERASRGRLTGYEAELGIERLRGRGIVETRRKAWGETIHTLAPGLLADWQAVFAPGLREAATPEEAVEPSYEPKAGFAKLLLFFVAEAATNGLTLTQKGTFHKKDVQRLASRIDVANEDLAGLAVDYLHRDKLDKPLAVLFDAALRLGLLRPGPGAVEPAPERIAAWLARPNGAIQEELTALWWDVYTPADVWLQHAAAAIRGLPAGRWFSLRRLADALLAAGVPTNGRTEEEAREAIAAYWAGPMAAFGLLELGACADGPAVRRPEPQRADEDDGWYVQPDFDVIVPPTAPFAARWELEACAEYAGGDTVDRYRLTKASWERALARGREPERLLAALKAHALYGVPEPVETALRQWSAAYGAVTLEDVTLLRCRDAKDAAYIRGDEELSACLVAQLGELDFIVDRSKAKALADRLQRQGFSLRQAGERAPAAMEPSEDAAKPEEAARRSAPSGIVYSRRNAALFPLDPSPEGTKPLRDKLAAVPQAWLRSLRKYHASTTRELLEAAIDVRTKVRLVVDGREVDFVPKRVAPSGADWVAQGYIDGEEASVTAAACGEAQLLVPEQA